MSEERLAPIPLGSWVESYGEVGMVGFISGERYYWCVRDGIVSMMPADVLEKQYFGENNEHFHADNQHSIR